MRGRRMAVIRGLRFAGAIVPAPDSRVLARARAGRARPRTPRPRRGRVVRWPVALNVPWGAGAPTGRFHRMEVGLIGAGNMARALARGWGDPVLCSDAGSGRARGPGRGARRRGARVQPRGGRARRSGRAVPQAGAARRRSRPRSPAHAKAVASVLGGTADRGAAGGLPRHAGVPGDAQHAGRGPAGRGLLRAAPTTSIRELEARRAGAVRAPRRWSCVCPSG